MLGLDNFDYAGNLQAKSRCEQLIDRAPRHPSAFLTAAVDQFYKYCSSVLGKLKKCLLRGQRYDEDTHEKLQQLLIIYTPHWRLGQVAKTVSKEEYSQYICSLVIEPGGGSACHDENADVTTFFLRVVKGIDFLLLYSVMCGLLINIIIFVGLKIENRKEKLCVQQWTN